MRILGLTGSIGMGKSTAAAMLKRMGIPVHCADDCVHALMTKDGKAVAAIAKLYPAAFNQTSNSIDRAVLGKAAFHDAKLLKQLEGILHPLVREQERAFLKRNRALREPIVVLDIPLLFETGAQKRVDAIIVVSAPSFVQRARVLSRPRMTTERLATILTHQTPDAVKRKYADVVIPTGLGKAVTYARLRAFINKAKRN